MSLRHGDVKDHMGGRNSGAWSANDGLSIPERRARLRERFFAVGLDLFGRDGFALTSVERLCAAAGASPRDFYREFNDRVDLLIGIHDQITTEAMRALSIALAAHAEEPLAQRIEAGVRAYVGVTAADQGRARVAYVEMLGVGAVVERHRLAWRDRIVDLLTAEAERAVARGEAVDRDYRLTAIAIVGTLNELAYQWARHPGERSTDEIIAELVRLIVAALTAGSDPQRPGPLV